MNRTSRTQRSRQISRSEAEEWASWFAAIGDPTRLLILHLLSTEQRPLTVGEITERLDVGQSCVRFRKIDDVPFKVIGDAIAAIPVDEFVSVAKAVRASR